MAKEIRTMDVPRRRDELEQMERVREIPKWTRRYAQNRTLPVAVSLVIFVLGSAAMGGLSWLGAWCLHTRAYLAASASLAALLGLVIFWVWFSFRGASRLIPSITAYLYRGEGSVWSGCGEEASASKTLGALVLGVCVALHVCLGVLGLLPLEYMQPISALYVVPAFLLMGVRMGKRSAGSPFMLLWPGLYALHAGLVVAGAPIQFTGSYTGLNMLIPVAGYGLVAALVGHLYSRFALRRLRAVASGVADEGIEGGDEQ
jgi:hypothetical protein